MACNNNEYFVGNGDVLIRAVGDDCGAVSGGWRKLGDASELMINNNTSFGNHNESQSGNRNRAARWIQGREVDFTLSVQNFSVENLADLLLGTDSGAVAAGTVTDEEHTDAYDSSWMFLDYQGVTVTSVYTDSGGTLLALNTDYTVDSRNGGILFTAAGNIVDNTVTVTYDHVGIEGAIEALTTNSRDYQLRFNGVNLNSANKPIVVQLHRAQVSGSEEFSVIGTEVTNLTFTGALLPDGSGNFFSVTKANQVS